MRCAARAELTGYRARAAGRRWWWLDPAIAELGLTSMARGRHAMVTGRLLTKRDANQERERARSLTGELLDTVEQRWRR